LAIIKTSGENDAQMLSLSGVPLFKYLESRLCGGEPLE
jgi:hypothetical protein